MSVLPPPSRPFRGTIEFTAERSVPDFPPQPRPPEGAPNVIVVLLDDVGFGQTSTFGGAAQTPELDTLARSGFRYTQFHTTSTCSPTRAAMLTGRNHHAVANGCIVEWATGFPGYTGILPRSSATISTILRATGYATAAFGKWHNTPEWEMGPTGPFDRWPTGLGFEYFYGFMGGDCDQFVPSLFENTIPIEPPRAPQAGYTLDEDLADRAIFWVRRHRTLDPERPFFLWYAPGTAHSPLHAPKQWIERYAGRFDHGWDSERERTLQRQKAQGLVPAETELTRRPDEIPSWDSLPPTKRKLAARYQEVFAAAVSHCDHQIGRVFKALDELGARDNTLILYVVGDNGPAAESGIDGAFNKFAKINGLDEDEQSILQRIDEIGGPTSFSGYPAGWAWAGSCPLQWFKQIASHFGGTRNGMVVSWPRGKADRGQIRTQFHHCVDIAPTILEAAGIPKPAIVDGVAQSDFDGVSMLYSFHDAGAPSKRRRQYFEMIGNRAIYQDGWVAAARHGPLPWQFAGGTLGNFEGDRWELYDITRDFSQSRDMAQTHAERLRELQETWMVEAGRNDVFPLDDRRGTRIAASTRPNPRGNQRTFQYFPGTIRVPEGLAPNVKGRSHRIRCTLDYRIGDAGVLVAAGGRTGGYVLLLQDGRLNYTYNLCGTQFYTIVSEPLAESEHVLTCDFQTDEPRLGAGGTVLLTSGAREIGRGRVGQTVPFRFSWTETFNVGRDCGTPVTDCYLPPFPYSGRLRDVTIEVLSELDGAERRREIEETKRITVEQD